MATTAAASSAAPKLRYCSQPPRVQRQLPPGVAAGRAEAIITFSKKWVAGTDLTYYCFRPGDGSPSKWQGKPADIQAVRDAFKEWYALGVSVTFREVQKVADAMVRIGFDQEDGSWSYVGRDTLTIPAGERTMNFGWPLNTAYGHDTALHEIGHALGLEHEHQNPFAGIVWNEPAVRAYFHGDPNFWSDAQINHNIIDKIAPTSVKGTTWDPDSVMEYQFGPGLISKPEKYASTGLAPAGGLSTFDKKWIRESYPKAANEVTRLKVGVAEKLHLGKGETRVFEFKPLHTRSYKLTTVGKSDTVLVLFELTAEGKVQIGADDDGGQDRNALITATLQSGKTYQAGVRLYDAGSLADIALKIS
jgi:hypothetical protein